jgi:hypothetical protein
VAIFVLDTLARQAGYVLATAFAVRTTRAGSPPVVVNERVVPLLAADVVPEISDAEPRAP